MLLGGILCLTSLQTDIAMAGPILPDVGHAQVVYFKPVAGTTDNQFSVTQQVDTSTSKYTSDIEKYMKSRGSYSLKATLNAAFSVCSPAATSSDITNFKNRVSELQSKGATLLGYYETSGKTVISNKELFDASGMYTRCISYTPTTTYVSAVYKPITINYYNKNVLISSATYYVGETVTMPNESAISNKEEGFNLWGWSRKQNYHYSDYSSNEKVSVENLLQYCTDSVLNLYAFWDKQTVIFSPIAGSTEGQFSFVQGVGKTGATDIGIYEVRENNLTLKSLFYWSKDNKGISDSQITNFKQIITNLTDKGAVLKGYYNTDKVSPNESDLVFKAEGGERLSFPSTEPLYISAVYAPVYLSYYNDGQWVDDRAGYVGETVTLLGESTVGTKTGYHFVGWSRTEASGPTHYSPNQQVKVEDLLTYCSNASPSLVLKLYAVWEANEYDITFHYNGTTFTGRYAYNQYIPKISQLSGGEKAGYRFVAWVDARSATSEIVFDNITHENVRSLRKEYLSKIKTRDGAAVSSLRTVDGTLPSDGDSLTYYAFWIKSWVSQVPSGNGTSSSPYLISSPENLKWMSEQSSLSGKHFRQTCDIDLNGGFFTAINELVSGSSYDGGGYKISNMFIIFGNDTITTYGCGLFANVSSSSVKNLTIENALVAEIHGSAPYSFGVVCGVSSDSTFNNITIKNCEICFTTDINPVAPVGGVSGQSTDCTFSNIDINGFKATGYYVGGVSGYSYGGTFNNITVKNIAVEGLWAGGVCGYYDDESKQLRLDSIKLYNGKCVGTSNAGGLIGKVISSDLKITNCANFGVDICSFSGAGGLIGYVQTNAISIFNVKSYADLYCDIMTSEDGTYLYWGGLIGRNYNPEINKIELHLSEVLVENNKFSIYNYGSKDCTIFVGGAFGSLGYGAIVECSRTIVNGVSLNLCNTENEDEGRIFLSDISSGAYYGAFCGSIWTDESTEWTMNDCFFSASGWEDTENGSRVSNYKSSYLFGDVNSDYVFTITDTLIEIDGFRTCNGLDVNGISDLNYKLSEMEYDGKMFKHWAYIKDWANPLPLASDIDWSEWKTYSNEVFIDGETYTINKVIKAWVNAFNLKDSGASYDYWWELVREIDDWC